jgi:hypothetical protein
MFMPVRFTSYTFNSDINQPSSTCLGEFNETDEIVAHEGIGQQHPFHLACVRGWLANGNRICPFGCGTEIDPTSTLTWKERVVNQIRIIKTDALIGVVAGLMPFEMFVYLCKEGIKTVYSGAMRGAQLGGRIVGIFAADAVLAAISVHLLTGSKFISLDTFENHLQYTLNYGMPLIRLCIVGLVGYDCIRMAPSIFSQAERAYIISPHMYVLFNLNSQTPSERKVTELTALAMIAISLVAVIFHLLNTQVVYTLSSGLKRVIGLYIGMEVLGGVLGGCIARHFLRQRT